MKHGIEHKTERILEYRTAGRIIIGHKRKYRIENRKEHTQDRT